MLCPCRQNWFGQLGSGNLQSASVPLEVAGEHNHFVTVSAGSEHTCGLLAGSKKIACFGENLHLELRKLASGRCRPRSPLGRNALY